MKRNIGTAQIIREYDEVGKFSVVRYNNETGVRCGTYAGLSLHAAFRDLLDATNRGQKVLVFTYPNKSDMIRDYEEAFKSEDKVSLARSFGQRR